MKRLRGMRYYERSMHRSLLKIMRYVNFAKPGMVRFSGRYTSGGKRLRSDWTRYCRLNGSSCILTRDAKLNTWRSKGHSLSKDSHEITIVERQQKVWMMTESPYHLTKILKKRRLQIASSAVHPRG